MLIKILLTLSFITSVFADRTILDNKLIIGQGGDNNVTIEANITGTNRAIRYNFGSGIWEASNDGTNFYPMLGPLTTKGDLATFSTVNTRLGVGANGTLLEADSTTSTGLTWSNRFQRVATGVTNWNDAVRNGIYECNNCPNAPTAGPWYIGMVTSHSGDRWITQEVWDFATASASFGAGVQKIWRRQSYDNGGVRTWTAWHDTSSYRLSNTQTFTTTGAFTWNKPNANVKVVKFIYCGGGGAGGGAAATGVGQRSFGHGGAAGGLFVCNIVNPNSSISGNIGARGTGVLGGNGGNGGDTTITGCTTATGGTGGGFVGAGSGRSYLSITVLNSNRISDLLLNTTDPTNIQNFYGFNGGSNQIQRNGGSTQGFDLIGDGTANSAISGIGGAVFFNGLYSFGGRGRLSSGVDNGVGNCSGGGGALTLRSGSAKVGGNGTAGAVIALSYE